jgi:transcriptional regulator with XRE-family HTH domain
MAEETLAQRVRRLRLQRGLSQYALADLARVTRQHVYDVERGHIKRLRGSTLARYAEALSESPVYIEYGYDRPPGKAEEWPPLEVALRHTSRLGDEEITQVARIVRALEAEQELARLLREREETPQK